MDYLHGFYASFNYIQYQVQEKESDLILIELNWTELNWTELKHTESNSPFKIEQQALLFKRFE